MIDTPLIQNCTLLKAIKKRNKKLTRLSSYLTQLESHLALIFATSPDIMMLINSKGKIIKVNKAITDIFGPCNNQLEGKYLWQTKCFKPNEDLIKENIQKLTEPSNKETQINGIITTCKTKNNTSLNLKWKFVIGDKQKKYIVAIASELTR